MTELNAFAAWEASLTNLGYHKVMRSEQGGAWFECDGKPGYRVSPFEPNEATACWMQRNRVLDARCAWDDSVVRTESDLPEFGLEMGTDYHEDFNHITKSMLSVFMSSPVEYRCLYILGTMERKKPTPAMNMGLILHSMLLEHKRIDEAAIAYPYSCYNGDRLNSKRAEEFAKSVKPLIAVRESEIPTIERVVKSARASEFGRLLELKGDAVLKFETPVYADLWGLPCKCRPDLHIVCKNQVIVPDLKFGAFKPEDWRRSSTRFSYWLQQAHYSAILEKEYGLPVSWSFWAGETEPPWRFGPKEYDSRSIEIAAAKHKQLAKELKRCYDTDEWQDNYDPTVTIAPWEMGGEDEDVEIQIGGNE